MSCFLFLDRRKRRSLSLLSFVPSLLLKSHAIDRRLARSTRIGATASLTALVALAVLGSASLSAQSDPQSDPQPHVSVVVRAQVAGRYVVRLEGATAIEGSHLATDFAQHRRSLREQRLTPKSPSQISTQRTLAAAHAYSSIVAPVEAGRTEQAGTWRRSRLQSPAFKAELVRVDAALDTALADLSSAIGRPLGTLYRYRNSLLGFSALLSSAEADVIRRRPGVLTVEQVEMVPLNSDLSAELVGATEVWAGTDTGVPTRGAGILVGLIDSGIQMDHQSFATTPGDGHINPFGAGVHVGECNDADPNFRYCSDKLVGVWEFLDGDPIGEPDVEPDGAYDNTGHGTHVASTAVGIPVDVGTVTGFGTNPVPQISGIAPLASLISYDVCNQNCFGDAILLAIDQAILDGVDVLNISIRGGTSPWSSLESAALLAATDAGIVVVASAGNDGPTASSISRLDPWVITVGAASHDRVSYQALLTPSGGSAPPAPIIGAGMGDALAAAEVVYGGDFYASVLANKDSCPPDAAPINPLAFDGKIVACEIGLRSADKAETLRLLGAVGMIELSIFPTSATVYPSSIPYVRVFGPDTVPVRNWIQAGGSPQASFDAAAVVRDPARADKLFWMSSRGPVTQYDLIKPDLVAPGFGILGADYDDLQPANPAVHLQFQFGTSMSTPQVVGAAALLLSLDPTLSPAEIKSIVQTTSISSGLETCDAETSFEVRCLGTTQPADIFDYGSGKLAVDRAARSGLALDETTANFSAADPLATTPGDPSSLNLASMARRDCPGGCAFKRVVDSLAPGSVQWSGAFSAAVDALPSGLEFHLVPDLFDLDAATSQQLMVAVYADSAALENSWHQALLTLTPNDPTRAQARLPIAVFTSASAPSTDLSITVDSAAESVDVGEAATYQITVSNLGSVTAVGATVTVNVPLDLDGMTWDCAPGPSSPESLCSLDSGSGALAESVAIGAGQSVVFMVTGTVANPNTSENLDVVASVSPPSGLSDPVPANDQDTETDAIALFSDGFETGDVSRWS